jgi:hypothetical protein
MLSGRSRSTRLSAKPLGGSFGESKKMNKLFKKRWWVPLVALFTPGSCFLISAYFPTFSETFLLISLLLIVITIIIFTLRVLQPPGNANPMVQFVILQLFTLSGLLFSIRLGLKIMDNYPSAIIISVLVIFYILFWILPYLFSSITISIHEELWHPKSKVMKAIQKLLLGLGGAAGIIGAILGRNLSRSMGPKGMVIFLFILVYISTLLASWFFSTNILRLRKDQSFTPNG